MKCHIGPFVGQKIGTIVVYTTNCQTLISSYHSKLSAI